MAHSIELLLDDVGDRGIRDQWAALAAAGLPSQGRIDAPTNRPHVTLVAAPALTVIPAALSPFVQRLPFRAGLGALVVFGSGATRTLARLVVPSEELLTFHSALTSTLADADGQAAWFTHCSPARWTPHVTLARRLDPSLLGDALAVLDELPPTDTTAFDAVRIWNGDDHTEQIIRAPIIEP